MTLAIHSVRSLARSPGAKVRSHDVGGSGYRSDMTFDFALARGDFDSATYQRESVNLTVESGIRGAVVTAVRENGEFAVVFAGNKPALWQPESERLEALVSAVPDSSVWFMGRTPDGFPLLVVVLPDDLNGAGSLFSVLPGNVHWMEIMDFAPELEDLASSLLVTQATALLAWHSSTKFCPRCGSLLAPGSAGWTARCAKCGNIEYPRTDPAVIVAVLDPEDRLLHAHNVLWPTSRMSQPAGYVDAGESAERAVPRELREEVGIEVFDLRYLGSQPWPRPRSLMLAYSARTGDTVPVPDNVEIDRARFFTRDELRQAVDSAEVQLPGPASVAHTVIDLWLRGEL